MKVRKCKKEDLTKVANLWKEFMQYNKQFNDSFEINDKAKDFFSVEVLDKISNSNNHLTVAEQDNDIIGFCYSYISKKPKYYNLGKFGFIGDLYVIPEYRRQKVGNALVNDALDFFRENKISQIELLVAVRNEATIKFWESLGFEHLLTWMYKRN